MSIMQNHAASPIRAIHSLRESDQDIAQLAMSLVGSDWTVLQHETYDGHLLLLLCGRDDESWFSIHGSLGGVHLGRLLDDVFQELGCYENVAVALRAAGESVALLEKHMVA